MKIHTVENLSDFLDSETSWRRKELSQIKNLVLARKGRKDEPALVRCGVAVLYAHWEGFIKTAGDAYVQFVGRKRLRYEDLSSNFVALAMKSKLGQAAETSKASIYVRVAEFILSRLSERARLNWKAGIKTRSNLNSSVLEDIVCLLGLDFSPFATVANLIDKRLVGTRNQIAHGQYLLLQCDDYVDLHDRVIELIRIFRDQVDNAAATGAFRKAPTS